MRRQASVVALLIIALWPTVAHAQGAPIRYDVRVPSKLPGCYAPVASNLIGSNENDHSRRGSPTLAYDWSAAVGSPVFSICHGKVRTASNDNRGGYGSYVIIDHSDTLSTLYAHCIVNSFMVRPGDTVTASTPICRVGRTGMTSWPHVHLNIDVSGRHTNVGQYFDPSLLHYCHFTKCQATNNPGATVNNASPQTTAGQPTTVADTRYNKLLAVLRTVKPEVVSMSVVGLFALLCLLWWLGGLYERVFVVALGTSMVVVSVALWLVLPVGGQPVSASQQVMGGRATWDQVYPIIQSMEGWKCTEDGAHTLGGVTQGTYNRWRAKKSMGSADVCTSLTRAQAKAIYYELFWLPIGADKMPVALALTAVDHYINTGKVSHLLAQCGTDVACFNKARIADYKTKGNCSLYCQAWINRVNRIRKYTGG